jgi:hypothetical protein
VRFSSESSKRSNIYGLSGSYDRERKYYRGENKEIYITPISGSTSWFPFDSLSFDISVYLIPYDDIKIPSPAFSEIHLYQELEGGGYVFVNPEFVPIRKNAQKGATIQLRFRLARKLFAQIAFIVYALFVILYVVIIVASNKKVEKMVIPLVGFFVSVWSLREGLNSFNKGHTTLVDYFFLLVPLAFLLLLVAKIVRQFYYGKRG